MCLIAFAKDKLLIPNTNLTRGFSRNNDAWGIMYPDGERVRMTKATNNLEDFFAAWREVPDLTPVASHFRYATHGTKTVDNAHPFDVLGDGRIGMMHNGVISSMGTDKDLSDTAIFVRDWIKPQLEHSPELLEVDAWRGMVADFIGRGSKLLFMTGDGRTFIINDKAGTWEDTVWYSNTYSIAPVVERGVGVPQRFHGAPHYGNYPLGYYGESASEYGSWDAVNGWQPNEPKSNEAPKEKMGEGSTASCRVEVAPDGTAKVVTLTDEKERLAKKASEARKRAEAAKTESLSSIAKQVEEFRAQKAAELDRQIDARTCDPMVKDIQDGMDEEFNEYPALTAREFRELSVAEAYNWSYNADPDDVADLLLDLAGFAGCTTRADDE